MVTTFLLLLFFFFFLAFGDMMASRWFQHWIAKDNLVATMLFLVYLVMRWTLGYVWCFMCKFEKKHWMMQKKGKEFTSLNVNWTLDNFLCNYKRQIQIVLSTTFLKICVMLFLQMSIFFWCCFHILD
jgi:hypothetical protein